MIGRLDRCLNDLNRFCHNKLRAYLNIDQEFGTINSFIQNVLREQLFIELLVQLLALSFPRVENLNEIKKFEEQKNRKLQDAPDSRFNELDKSNLSPSSQPSIHFVNNSVCVQLGDLRGVRKEEEKGSNIYL